eukprot:833383-Lingulodinium_polyedra.AAC.1
MSLIATFESYHALRAPTPGSALYAQRTHYVSKLEVAVLVWLAVELPGESKTDVAQFEWRLRPHRVAE